MEGRLHDGGYAAAGGGGGGRSRHGKLFSISTARMVARIDVCVPPFLDPSSHSLDFI